METDTISKAPKILGTAKLLGYDLITKYDRRESEQIARILVEYVTNKPYKWLLMYPDAVFSDEEFFVWTATSARLLQGEPIQYVTGIAYFHGLELHVEPGVLIPRPETEELVDWALKSPHNQQINYALDIGTGSGCIALAIAAALPLARVIGVDLSEIALAVAQANSDRLKLSVVFHICDVLKADSMEFSHLDLIVSNPPYIPRKEYLLLDDHVRLHEPLLALEVPDDDPILFYTSIAAVGLHWLRPGGWLLMEIHADFGPEIVQMLWATGFEEVELRKDLSGRDRMVGARKQI